MNAALPWLAMALALLTALCLFVALQKQNNKNNELSNIIQELGKQIRITQDSQQGLGKHLLGLERQLSAVVPASSGQAPREGTLARIADALQRGNSEAEVIAELGVSEAEVQLVSLILSNTAGDPS